MKQKKNVRMMAALLLSAVLLQYLPALALEQGSYTAAVETYYLNPDTGITDDGGTKNAALGEGMCRSAVYETGLIEVENGEIYVTIRMLLASNIKNTSFSVQQTVGDTDSYQSVSASIMAENAANDSKDYRFAVPAAGSYIRCSMYVTPMGRDVTFYIQVQDDGAVAGSGDFIVSVSPAPVTEAAVEPTEQEEPATQSAAVAETTSAPISEPATASQAASTNESAAASPAAEAAQTTDSAPSAERTEAAQEAGESAVEEAPPEENTTEDERAQFVETEAEQELETADPSADEDEAVDAVSSSTRSSSNRALVIAIHLLVLLALIAIVVAVVLILLRRRKRK